MAVRVHLQPIPCVAAAVVVGVAGYILGSDVLLTPALMLLGAAAWNTYTAHARRKRLEHLQTWRRAGLRKPL